METLRRYLDALARQDWDALSGTLAEDVKRTGPYLDVVEGRKAYTEFLSRVVPTLPEWRLDVSRIRALDDGAALVELSETLAVNGVPTRYPEALIFDFDEAGLIRRVDIFIKQPPTGEG
jgi:hypothetical protein